MMSSIQAKAITEISRMARSGSGGKLSPSALAVAALRQLRGVPPEPIASPHVLGRGFGARKTLATSIWRPFLQPDRARISE